MCVIDFFFISLLLFTCMVNVSLMLKVNVDVAFVGFVSLDKAALFIPVGECGAFVVLSWLSDPSLSPIQ